jgi:hypothetical protein
MLNHILTYILFFSAGMWNAVMDTLKDHFSSSIWWNKIKEKYDPSYTWRNKKFLGMVLDPWHKSKTMMLWLLCICKVLNTEMQWWEAITLYIIWGFGFGLGYNYLFKRK